MVKCRRWVIVVFAIGLTRATHHLVRVTILAVLGLAGLYMLHTLAQDFQKIYQQIQQGQGPGRAILNTIAANPIYRNLRNNVGKGIADTLAASGNSFIRHRSDDTRKALCADGLNNYCDFNTNYDKNFGGYDPQLGVVGYGGQSAGFPETTFPDFSSKGIPSYIQKNQQDWGFSMGTSGGKPIGYVLTKRSIPEEKENSAVSESSNSFNYPEINWEKVLTRDPASCARSLICQLAAVPETDLKVDEESILHIVRIATKKDDWASKELREALKYGESTRSIGRCQKYYLLCPYSGQTMMKILRFFGGSS